MPPGKGGEQTPSQSQLSSEGLSGLLRLEHMGRALHPDLGWRFESFLRILGHKARCRQSGQSLSK